MRDKRTLWFMGKSTPIVLTASFSVAANGVATLITANSSRGTTINTGTDPWLVTFPVSWLCTLDQSAAVNSGTATAAKFAQLGTINASAGTVVVGDYTSAGTVPSNVTGDVVTVTLVVSNNPADNH